MKSVLKNVLVKEYKGEDWQRYLQVCEFDNFLAEAAYWEAVPTARLYVIAEHEQAPRLAKAIRSVWLSLPKVVRDRLVDYWQSTIPGLLPGVPTIEVEKNLGSIAMTSQGTSFAFNSGIVEAMPDIVLLDVVAHEFGHAWSYTFDDSLIRTLSNKDYQLEIEWEADLAATHWGQAGRIRFDMNRWRLWAADRKKLIVDNLGRMERFVLKPLELQNVQPVNPAERMQ